MQQLIFQVDSFTDRPFAGNPAGVCVMRGPGDESWMQAVAAEMNLSETAFLYPSGDVYPLRWFTPAVEVDLCGHATLASAHILWQEDYVDPGRPIKFHTRSGVLVASRDGELIVMDFPAIRLVSAQAPNGLVQALGVEPTFVGHSPHSWFVEVATEEMLRGCSPDFGALLNAGAGRVILTCVSGDGRYDFYSRFFAPDAGINEDPVTGSAHCVLGPYWSGKLGRDTVTGFQASRRGGMVRVTVQGERVLLAGTAVTVMRCQLQ